MRKEPEPWQSGAAGPFIVIGDVGLWALGDQRFRIPSPRNEQEVEGFEETRTRARELAGLD
jgi:hypothetical protein